MMKMLNTKTAIIGLLIFNFLCAVLIYQTFLGNRLFVEPSLFLLIIFSIVTSVGWVIIEQIIKIKKLKLSLFVLGCVWLVLSFFIARFVMELKYAPYLNKLVF